MSELIPAWNRRVSEKVEKITPEEEAKAMRKMLSDQAKQRGILPK